LLGLNRGVAALDRRVVLVGAGLELVGAQLGARRIAEVLGMRGGGEAEQRNRDGDGLDHGQQP
jgi:hypothetical protein